MLFAAGTVQAAPAKPMPDKKMAAVRNTGLSFADCVVAKHYAEARQMVIDSPSNTIILKKHKKLADIDCMSDATDGSSMGPGMSFSGDTFTYMIADALVRKDFAGSGPASFEKVAPLVHEKPTEPDPAIFADASDKKRQAAQQGYARRKAWWILSMFGECAARLDPERARLLAQTVPHSPEEKAVLRQISPQLGPCLPADSSLKFQPVQFRGTLVTGYYRMAAPLSAAGSSVK